MYSVAHAVSFKAPHSVVCGLHIPGQFEAGPVGQQSSLGLSTHDQLEGHVLPTEPPQAILALRVSSEMPVESLASSTEADTTRNREHETRKAADILTVLLIVATPHLVATTEVTAP